MADFGGVAALAREHSGRDVANLCAVEVGSDAVAQFGHHVLAEACIRTRGARLAAGKASIDARRELFYVVPGLSRARAQHFSSEGHDNSSDRVWTSDTRHILP